MFSIVSLIKYESREEHIPETISKNFSDSFLARSSELDLCFVSLVSAAELSSITSGRASSNKWHTPEQKRIFLERCCEINVIKINENWKYNLIVNGVKVYFINRSEIVHRILRLRFQEAWSNEKEHRIGYQNSLNNPPRWMEKNQKNHSLIRGRWEHSSIIQY